MGSEKLRERTAERNRPQEIRECSDMEGQSYFN